jgi:serine phosphatase RsbU (regulator of sigma subunit)
MQDTLHDQLGMDLARMQEWSRSTSLVQTLSELSNQFSGLCRQLLPCAEMQAFLRSKGSDRWELFFGCDGAGNGEYSGDQDSHSARTSIDPADGVMATQRLTDGSTFQLVARWLENTGERSTGYESTTLQLLVFAFESAYREFLVRKRGKELIFALNHRVLQLNSLIDTGIEVTRLGQEESPTRLALERAAALTNASAGRVRVLCDEKLKDDIVFPAGLNLAAQSVGQTRIETDIEFEGDIYLFELFDKESREGVVQFEPTDHLLLDALARQVQASLVSRHLHRQALEKQRMEQDLVVAASIQERLIPKELPVIGGYELAGINIPSKSVGGDYFDCIPLADGRYALVIADVAGKGIPAALLVSSLHAYLHAYLESTMSLVELVRRLNQVIYTASTDDKFITAFVGLLDPEAGTLESVNAGHNPVYHARADGTMEELNVGGIALGMLDMDFPYQSEFTTLAQGESILLYTDGIPEAVDETMQQYESHYPLKEFHQRHQSVKAPEFITKLIADIQCFTGVAPQIDDITALYVHRRA